MQYKVCGMTNMDQVHTLDEMGVDYIGFIFYPPSKRYVLNQLSLEQIANCTLNHAKKVGVFVNSDLNELLTIVNIVGLDIVQLHGDEDAAYCAQVNKIVPVIKVFRVGDALPNFEGYEQAASYFLFDTDSAMYGGTGSHFNWELLKNAHIPKPFFLSGGIGPNDIHGLQVMAQTKAGESLLGIDVNSQFETTTGIKNLEKIKTFIDVNI
jgi:phosphoribosylanthranilate isomerase